MLAFARFQEEAGRRTGNHQKPFTMQLLELGGARILGMPAEMFVQYGLDFAAQASGPLLALAYTNGVHGYLPTAADYPYGGYEVDGAHRYYGTLMYAPACEGLVRAAAYELLGVRGPDTTPYSVYAADPPGTDNAPDP
jgi:hypothetical protein